MPSRYSLVFVCGKRFGTAGEIFLPVAVGADVLFVFVDISVDHVVAVGAPEACL